MNKSTAMVAELSMTIDIAAPAQSVWKALTDDIGKWWPADFYAGGTAGERKYVLEARPGGRMYESWDSGGGVLWATVATVDPNVKLQVAGTSFPEWGGPATWLGTWTLEASDGGTRLVFSESTIGHLTEAGLAEKDKGWQFLWRNLKAFVEGAPPPAWGE